MTFEEWYESRKEWLTQLSFEEQLKVAWEDGYSYNDGYKEQMQSAYSQLLKYGNHTKDCDLSSELPVDDGKPHFCCSCNWCLAQDWATLLSSIK